MTLQCLLAALIPHKPSGKKRPEGSGEWERIKLICSVDGTAKFKQSEKQLDEQEGIDTPADDEPAQDEGKAAKTHGVAQWKSQNSHHENAVGG